MTSAETRSRTGPAWLRPVVAVLGLLYLALGIAGWLTPETATVGHVTTHQVVGLFSASALLNLVHTAVGVLGLLAATRGAGAVIYCWVLFVGFAGMTAYGVLATAFSTPDDDPININWADNVLHGLTAVAGLVLGIAGARSLSARQRRTTGEDNA
ncbi:protein of unknown function [Amycolatopsis pretoriensis]|uniref:DUF4383 domain-containing protein n=1 Tax=Amycolatopsis pretoriensis TaxID=218821 RepID=A0A1H5Q4H9_9PSEU|nr:DUF4383 domain-containing protein [Amycolatopsis pretoriensis]SEF20945.1 protein of unknown function [Amycolatopsis pretoriensis]